MTTTTKTPIRCKLVIDRKRGSTRALKLQVTHIPKEKWQHKSKRPQKPQPIREKSSLGSKLWKRGGKVAILTRQRKEYIQVEEYFKERKRDDYSLHSNY